jgi:hypothetical protein
MAACWGLDRVRGLAFPEIITRVHQGSIDVNLLVLVCKPQFGSEAIPTYQKGGDGMDALEAGLAAALLVDARS